MLSFLKGLERNGTAVTLEHDSQTLNLWVPLSPARDGRSGGGWGGTPPPPRTLQDHFPQGFQATPSAPAPRCAETEPCRGS